MPASNAPVPPPMSITLSTDPKSYAVATTPATCSVHRCIAMLKTADASGSFESASNRDSPNTWSCAGSPVVSGCISAAHAW